MARNIMQLRTALEFAKFDSPDIRDAVAACIKSIDSDMEEVEYSDGLPTIQAFRELNACISEYENKSAPLTSEPVVDDEVDGAEPEPEIVFDMKDEVERVTRTNNDSLDDDEGDIER